MARVQTRRTISVSAAMCAAVRDAAAASGTSVSEYTHEALSRLMAEQGRTAPPHATYRLLGRNADEILADPAPITVRQGLAARRGRPPILTQEKRDAMASEAIEAIAAGRPLSCRAIAERFGVHPSTARGVLVAADVPRVGRGRPQPERRKSERRDHARTMRAAGKTLQQIADALGVSRERARQLLLTRYAGEISPASEISREG